ncbi:hypothetical protein DFP72DRAFT_1060000 [Ephemerocybe angulata]|uniref:Uncharacterized protein n=1 Tax=Ephemerocybe angulata TaxID=980116 RepID=A0A8H6MGN0_9AGAR|nr:hypothetical protein DFP72DRAFT_1060000 [Tulosesus angulatus]
MSLGVPPLPSSKDSTPAIQLMLADLPFDLQEAILSEIRTTGNLLCLEHYWKSLIIPAHIEYRVLRVSNYEFYEPLWRHLAERGDLASRIRKVTFGKEFFRLSDKKNGKYLYADDDSYPFAHDAAFPRSFLNDCGSEWAGIPYLHSNEMSEPPILQALRNMTSLTSFSWQFPSIDFVKTAMAFDQHYNEQSPRPGLIFDALKTLPVLLDMKLRELNLDASWPFLRRTESEYFKSVIRLQEGSNFSKMLKRMADLHTLSIDSSHSFPFCFKSCKIPSLRNLSLKYIGWSTKNQEKLIVDFLISHPVIHRSGRRTAEVDDDDDSGRAQGSLSSKAGIILKSVVPHRPAVNETLSTDPIKNATETMLRRHQLLDVDDLTEREPLGGPQSSSIVYIFRCAAR